MKKEILIEKDIVENVLNGLDGHMDKYIDDLKYEVLFLQNSEKYSLKSSMKEFMKKIIYNDIDNLILREVGVVYSGFINKEETYERLLENNLSLIYLQNLIFERFLEIIDIEHNLIVKKCDDYIIVFFHFKDTIKPIIII